MEAFVAFSQKVAEKDADTLLTQLRNVGEQSELDEDMVNEEAKVEDSQIAEVMIDLN